MIKCTLAGAGNSRRAKRYFPFAEGARSCVGQSLAMTSLLATLALLLSRFSFRLADQASTSDHARDLWSRCSFIVI